MVSIIVAHGRNLEIGQNGHMPWPRLSEDLKRFKQITAGHAILMGYNTFKSLDCNPLPGRINIVATGKKLDNSFLTKDKEYDNLFYTNEPDAIIRLYTIYPKVEFIVIGGASLYKLAMKYATKFYITEIDDDFPDADTYMPNYKERILNAQVRVEPHFEGLIKYTFKTYTL